MIDVAASHSPRDLVSLLDEIEKAHPDVMNIFLGVFDEGRITDNRGRLIDCSNAMLDRPHLAKILDQILAQKSQMFEAEKGLTIKVDPLARSVLLDRGYSPDMGARSLERAVDEWVVQPLVDAWFANRFKGGPVRFTVAASVQSVPGAPKIVFSQD